MEKTKDIAVFVATHQKIDAVFPEGYIPMQVNCASSGIHWEGYYHDDFGDNISHKNPFYSELTVLYSAWKNCDAAIKGLAHYRRYMNNNSEAVINNRILCDINKLEMDIINKEEILARMNSNQCDILLVMPAGPYPRTGREGLERYCYPKDVETMIAVVEEFYSEYAHAMHKVLQSKNLSNFNMLIARKEIFDGYCEWLFDVLEAVESRCDLTGYDTQRKRLYGYLSEVLLNVYFEKHKYKKQYLGLVSPYQYVNASRGDYEKQRKRNRQRAIIRKLRLTWLVENIYKVKSPDAFAKYAACKRFIDRQ